MNIEALVNECGFIPTEYMEHWRESLDSDQRNALDEYMARLFEDAESELEAF